MVARQNEARGMVCASLLFYKQEIHFSLDPWLWPAFGILEQEGAGKPRIAGGSRKGFPGLPGEGIISDNDAWGSMALNPPWLQPNL